MEDIETLQYFIIGISIFFIIIAVVFSALAVCLMNKKFKKGLVDYEPESTKQSYLQKRLEETCIKHHGSLPYEPY